MFISFLFSEKYVYISKTILINLFAKKVLLIFLTTLNLYAKIIYRTYVLYDRSKILIIYIRRKKLLSKQAISLSYLYGGKWIGFSDQTKSTMDCLKIKTSSNESFYLQYRTWNKGMNGYYPYVKSTENDYAGSSGKPIQQLQIQAYRNDGTKLVSGVVVMYRAFVENKWLPWVSNADPEWMDSVRSKYNLGGTLDTSSSYAGISGKNISGMEIRVYKESSLGNYSGGESNPSLSYMVGNESNWKSFSKSTLSSKIDGIKIQTGSNKDYYLTYRTWNEGQSSYYPAVNSTENDYAGSPGKAIQRLSINVYRNNGTKLTSGIIVMYRVYTDSRWLPWVSNADPEWMRNVKTKYSLNGTLDTGSSYAGIDGKNIGGVEIRIFEEDSLNAGSGSFVGSEELITTQYMANSTSNWKSFNHKVMASPIDGIKIQTNSNSDFYLRYKTWNEGQSYYYPEVTSLENDYAGYPNKPIQGLSISAYSKDGTKLTAGVVVMYRAYVDGRWLPWVSNADPEWMQDVQENYNLGGTLDVSSSYAGIIGKNISGVEIYVFNGKSISSSIGNLSGGKVASTLSYIDEDSNWHSFTSMASSVHINGIKIKTDKSKPYYLLYRTWNEGKSYYYPFVKSNENDYAGYPGGTVQLLNIQVYSKEDVKLTSGVVVMYRVHVEGNWLPWVSNADPKWMRSVQSKYNLDGTLDTGSSYAGIDGKNINGVEIHIYEENEIYTKPQTPIGNSKIIQAPFISQLGKYPTGCESVTTVMALNHIGIDVSVDKFIDSYLTKTGVPFDPSISFGGNPRSTSGYGCYAPVIKKALDKALSGKNYEAKVLNNVSLKTLCSQYIDKGIPVILWATMYMNTPYISSTWTYNGKTINWIAPEHCLLLVGYDSSHYIFNDPLTSHPQTYYSKSSVEAAYKGLNYQAIVLEKKDTSTPAPTPAPVYKYGAVKNPENGIIYPIEYLENGKQYIDVPYKLEKTTKLTKNSFNAAKFISGLAFDDSLVDKMDKAPLIGSIYGIVVGGITSFAESWESLYIDVEYWQDKSSGKRRAFVKCGESNYCNFFNNLISLKNLSMKDIHGYWSGANIYSAVVWETTVNDFAKGEYGKYKGIVPNDSYNYDIVFTFDERRRSDKHVSWIFCGENGKMYEYATIYDSEKIEIVVKNFWGTEVDRINIMPQINPVSELPQDKAALFEFVKA